MIFKCNCSYCTNNKSYILWKKINTIDDKNIIWKKSSLLVYRGYQNNINTYMYYIWGGKYKNVTNANLDDKICEVPYILKLLVELSEYFYIIYKSIDKIYIIANLGGFKGVSPLF